MKMVGIPRTCPLLDSSFPRTRESRFGLRQISLDTRFRGYDGAPGGSSLFISSPHRYFRRRALRVWCPGRAGLKPRPLQRILALRGESSSLLTSRKLGWASRVRLEKRWSFSLERSLTEFILSDAEGFGMTAISNLSFRAKREISLGRYTAISKRWRGNRIA
jgi:hypothetical protein